MLMASKSSKWEMVISHHNDEVEVKFTGPSKSANDLLAIEALLRNLNSWDMDIDFKEGKAPKNITKKWFLPLKKVKAKLNPGSSGKKKGEHDIPQEAVELYRQFNNTEPNDIVVKKVWLPDANSPLVALGEGYCPFVGYSSAKASKKGDIEKYIHHFGEEGGEKPRIYVTCPPKGHERVIMILGGDWKIEEREDNNLWLVD